MDEDAATPATYVLAGLWVSIYVAMLAVQGSFETRVGLLSFGRIHQSTAHLFGDFTAMEVSSGQVWRTVTATMIHFSLAHLLINLIGLWNLGRIIESWYGSAQFLAVYVLIGFLGNMAAAAARILLHTKLNVECAGGSSILFGFVGLIAVVGWRSKTRFGDYVRHMMIGKLLIYGVLLGIAARDVLDSYGHAGGALAGAVLGFSHRVLIRTATTAFAKVVGLAALASLVTVGVIQGRVAFVEVRTSQKLHAEIARRGNIVRTVEEKSTTIF